MTASSIRVSRKQSGLGLHGACQTIVATTPIARVELVVTFAGLASADNKVADPDAMVPACARRHMPLLVFDWESDLRDSNSAYRLVAKLPLIQPRLWTRTGMDFAAGTWLPSAWCHSGSSGLHSG